MAKRNKRSFRSVDFREEVIEDNSGVVGTIRIKPSTVMWKPKNTRKYYFSATIEEFEEWIMNKTPVKKMTK